MTRKMAEAAPHGPKQANKAKHTGHQASAAPWDNGTMHQQKVCTWVGRAAIADNPDCRCVQVRIRSPAQKTTQNPKMGPAIPVVQSEVEQGAVQGGVG